MPATPGIIDCHMPNWHLSRAPRSARFLFTLKSPSDNNFKALSAIPSQKSFERKEHKVSIAWSSARTPVENQSQSGVWRVIAGSKITVRGTSKRCRYPCFTFLAGFLAPAIAVNSPPERVVGTATKGMSGPSKSGEKNYPSCLHKNDTVPNALEQLIRV